MSVPAPPGRRAGADATGPKTAPARGPGRAATAPPVGCAIYTPGLPTGRQARPAASSMELHPGTTGPTLGQGHYGARGIGALAGPKLEYES